MTVFDSFCDQFTFNKCNQYELSLLYFFQIYDELQNNEIS